MNYLNLIFRICADELYFFTFILFIDSKMTKSYFKTSFLFFQVVILFYQFSTLRAFPIGTLFLIAVSTFYIQFIWKYNLKQSLWISIQFIISHYILSFLIVIILFFVVFHHMSLPSFYQNIVFRNLTYYSLSDI